MAKPEWGSKRICPSCGARYYDLLREPVICPKCATPFDAEAFLKSRRTRPAPRRSRKSWSRSAPTKSMPKSKPRRRKPPEEEEEAVPLEEAEEEDEELLEDASELGEDEDDMAEVIENVEEEEH